MLVWCVAAMLSAPAALAPIVQDAAVVPPAVAPADDAILKQATRDFVAGQYDAAIQVWRKYAARGNPDAEFDLGQAYKLGRGVPKDDVQAENWYHLAVTHGQGDIGEQQYGMALFTNKKYTEAAPWLLRQAKLGFGPAQLLLSTMYFNGNGVKKDNIKSYAWIIRANASSTVRSYDTKKQLDTYVSADDRAKGTLLAQWFETAGQAYFFDEKASVFKKQLADLGYSPSF